MTKTLTLIGICVAGAILAQMFLKLGLNRHGPIESFSLTTMIRLSRDPLILAASLSIWRPVSYGLGPCRVWT